jgi:ubiquinone/menaquinone biosynthesis C-methylase UbiE
VADALLAAAHLTPGEAVVDIGCGCGATTLGAARAVGSAGSAYGIDLSEPMLGVARRRAETSGLSNITLVQGDVQIHRFPARVDAAISRFGTMFFADQTAALANIRRGLRPRGWLCLATWQPLVANDWLTIPGAALLRYGSLPGAEASGRGMFAQSDAESVTATLHAAGYADPQFEPVELTLALGADPNEAVDYLAGTGRAAPSSTRCPTINGQRRSMPCVPCSPITPSWAGSGSAPPSGSSPQATRPDTPPC